MPLFHLIYVSTLHADLTRLGISTLLEKSVSNNRAVGVTGMLLISASNVLQVLEGEEQDVLNTFERIQRDTRHYDVTELLRQPIEKRNFGEWSMGYRHLNECPYVGPDAGKISFRLGFDAITLKAQPGIARSLLVRFSEMNT